MAERYIAQRATTGEWLSWDLPLTVDELTSALSGPGALSATVSPDVGSLRADDGELLLDEWGTLVYAEADGQIRWGGIVTRSRFDGPSWTVEGAGFSTYPHGIPYLGEYQQTSVDPLDAAREIWRHVQDHPDGDLGVVPDGTSSPVRLGTAEEPYELAWWESKDCGDELDQLARETPFDYVEEHAWSADRQSIEHRIRFGYPRLGRRRRDLSFVQGENVASLVTPELDGDDFANEVVGIGKGEGKASLRVRIPHRDGRLRRAYVYADKSIGSRSRLTALSRDELEARRLSLEITEITVRDHPNARIGSWQLGDDILVQAALPWLGDVGIWSRVVGSSLIGTSSARLQLKRSDSFRYGRSV